MGLPQESPHRLPATFTKSSVYLMGRGKQGGPMTPIVPSNRTNLHSTQIQITGNDSKIPDGIKSNIAPRPVDPILAVHAYGQEDGKI